ncbi:dolichyl-phosphate-mannose--protein mannosyltransferase [Nocardia transvalensis]|uniref:dolichyl-phosphate-mannose--protein mannosyltransferase n=1 Tax=Nocardia transvalensis TaxID=37333 RepID=UPI001894E709|nr:phospholipid carrier-dependent glycosyltransferase [Nocardia transvalensis]MBF6331236.1 phospholipid carrier-dependent glycosyltransferase [Nocardia transvalensis]
MAGPAVLRPGLDAGPADRARGWWVTAVLTLLAAVTRFVNLDHPTEAGTPVFDEKYYAAQAWEMLTNGMGVEDNPAYSVVVHPPVGKLLIAIGEGLFGWNAWGWRFSAAIAGTLLVLLVIRIVRRMTRSTMIGAIAGILMIADGVTFVQSRIGMLDIFQALFVTAAFGCLIVDRDEVRARMARACWDDRITPIPWGPRLGVRWWRFGAGVLLGLACGTKWSGGYFLLAFLLLTLAFDLSARRAYGVTRPWLGTVLRDGPPALFAFVFVGSAVYLASYTGWFASETGINRYAVGIQVGRDGIFSFVPDALRSLWYNHGAILDFHIHLTNSAGHHHPWESKPWTWPMGLRPMLYYLPEPAQTTGCGQPSCMRAVMLLGTPAIWWLAFPVLAWALWRTLTRRDWRYAAVLVGYGAAWLPWFVTLDRQMYYFYATAMAPFLIMLLAAASGEIIGRATEPRERRGTGLLLVCLYLGLVVANFLWIYPILTGLPITVSTWNHHMWLPSWR